MRLAIRAAKRGARVTSLTLSRAQQTLARQRVDDAGVGDRVDIELRDYRAAHGTYDAVVSVEMIEAVGERYWPTYFATLDRLVAPDGKVGLQAIVLEHDRMEATRDQYTWISKYIFPGGALPSVRAITENVREHTKLRITERFAFGSQLREDAALLARAVRRARRRGRSARVRHAVPADVGLLPRLLRGRVRDRLPRRRAARARARRLSDDDEGHAVAP